MAPARVRHVVRGGTNEARAALFFSPRERSFGGSTFHSLLVFNINKVIEDGRHYLFVLNRNKFSTDAKKRNTWQKTTTQKRVQRVLSRLPDAEVRGGRNHRRRTQGEARKVGVDARCLIKRGKGSASIEAEKRCYFVEYRGESLIFTAVSGAGCAQAWTFHVLHQCARNGITFCE